MAAHMNALAASAQPNKGPKRRKRILAFCVIAFLAWALPAFIAQWSKLNQKSAQLLTLYQQMDQLKQTNEETKREVARLNDKEYVEQKIRTELHWYKPGETVFPSKRSNP